MKNLLFILFALTLTLVSCETPKPSNVTTTGLVVFLVKVEHLMSEVDPGLNKVTLNDSTVILIYRGVESCTMLQLK